MQGNPLPESCVTLFITLCTGWILKKRTRKCVFSRKNVNNWNLEKEIRIYSPLTPDQPPLKGGHYVRGDDRFSFYKNLCNQPLKGYPRTNMIRPGLAGNRWARSAGNRRSSPICLGYLAHPLIRKSRQEPIGVMEILDDFLKILGRRERTKEEKQM